MSVFGPNTSGAGLLDQFLSTAYTKVLQVADNLDFIKAAALDIENIKKAPENAALAESAAKLATTIGNFFPSLGEGEIGTDVGSVFSYPDGAGGFIYRERVADGAGTGGSNSIELSRWSLPPAFDDPDGADMIGESEGGTVQDMLDILKTYSSSNVMRYIPKSEWAAIATGVSTYDAGPAIQQAVNENMEVRLPIGTFYMNTTVREATNSGFRKVIGSNRWKTVCKAGPALRDTNAPMFWFGNSNGHGNYRLWFEQIQLDGGDVAGKGTTGAIGIRAHECGTSFIGNIVARYCYTAIDALGCIGSTFGGHRTEINSCQRGLWNSEIPKGTPNSPDDTTLTASPLTLNDNINQVNNIWFGSVGQPLRLMGGLTEVSNMVFQSCGLASNHDLIHVLNANESNDYGGGPLIRNVWCEGGTYRSIIRIEGTRCCTVDHCFFAGKGSTTEQGILVIGSDGTKIRDISVRGTWTATPTEGRTGNHWLNVDAASRYGMFGPNYFTSNSNNYYINWGTGSQQHILIDNHQSGGVSNGLTVNHLRFDGRKIIKNPDSPAANLTIEGFYLVDVSNSFRVNGIQVVGAQRPPIANAAAGTEVATINAILATMRTHGLIQN